MPPAHVLTYIVRGMKYAFTSACAILAGYLMQTKSIHWREVIVLSIPVITSIFFFICYANRFHSIELRDEEVGAIQTVLQREALFIFPIIALLIFLLIATTQSISWKLLLAFGLYTLMYGLYGLFFILHPATEPIPIVRHRLVWPVVLSIGISLYYGLTFSNLSTSLKPLIPVGAILSLYIFSEALNFSKRTYLIVTLLFSLGFAIIMVMLQINLLSIPFLNGAGVFFSSMLFCVTASAYLAVFEAWKVTSDIAKGPRASQDCDMTAEPTNSVSRMQKANQYSMAALIALMISVWAMPFFFVFTQYGVFFLIGFAIHAFVSFSFWYIFGRGEYLKTLPWGKLKNVSGLVFLALLVLVTFLDTKPNQHFFKGFTSLDGLSLLAWISTLTLATFYLDLRRAFRRRNRKGVWARILATKINIIRILSVLCLFANFILVTLASTYSEGSEEYYKAELAFSVYGICIVLCFIVVLLDSFRLIPPMSTLGSYVGGLLILARVITSFLITLAVLMPSLLRGNGFYESALRSMPFFLAAVGGFALNDFHDIAKDRINKPYRAIPSGKLSPHLVLIFSLILLVISFILAIMISRSFLELVLYFSTLLGVTLYNFFVKYLSLSKTFLTSVISSLPLLYSVVMFGYPRVYLLLPLATAAFILGREWLMDIRDVEGDAYDGIITIPMLLGSNLTAKLGFAFQFLSVFLLFPIIINNDSLFAWVLLTVILLSVGLLMILWNYRAGEYRRLVVQSLWLPMLAGILMLVI